MLWEVRQKEPSFSRPAEGEPEPAEALRARIARSGEFATGEIMLAIDAGDRLLGEIQARQPRNGLPPGVFELGIEIFEPADRGQGYGVESIALFASHLFEQRGANRVQVTTDVDNSAMRELCERLGFGFEGVLRGFMPGREGPRDYAMYGLTKPDWEARGSTWTLRS